MHYQFFGRAATNLLLEHRLECQCAAISGAVKPGEEQLTKPRLQFIDPLCIVGVLVSERRPQ